MPHRLCSEPRCPWPATYKGRCRTHATRRNREARYPNRFYDKAKWRRTRRRYLFDHPMCEQDGCERLAEHVHHLKGIQERPDLAFDMANLQALCASHHSQETRREQVKA